MFTRIRLIALAAISVAGAALASAEPWDPQLIEQNAIAAELNEKGRACHQEIPNNTPGAQTCWRTCASYARIVRNALEALPSIRLAKMVEECNGLAANLGTATTSAPTQATIPPAPDYSARAATMPSKAAYCQQAEARIGCPVDPSEPNWFKREQMCNTARGCRQGCGDQRLAARLSSNPVSRDVMMLDRCEENHDIVKTWLDG